jgi:hypothetical protein
MTSASSHSEHRRDAAARPLVESHAQQPSCREGG